MKTARCLVAVLVFVLALAASACARRDTLEARLLHAEECTDRAIGAMDKADGRMAALDPDAAAGLLADARRALSDSDVSYHPEAGLLRDRLQKAEAKLVAVRKEKERRELAAAVAARRAKVEEAVRQMETTVGNLAKLLDEDRLDAAEDALEDLEEALDDGKALEARDAPYGAWAQQQRHALAERHPRVGLAGKALAFAQGPLARQTAAASALASAKTERDPAAKVERLTEAVEGFRRCSSDASRLLAETPGLATLAVPLASGKLAAPAVEKDCRAQAQASEKLLAAANKALARTAKATAKPAAQKAPAPPKKATKKKSARP